MRLRRLRFVQPSQLIFRFGLGMIFFYFGALAIVEPQVSAARFLNPQISDFVSTILPLHLAMIGFGILEAAIGLAILFGIYLRLALVLAGVLLIGIIVSLGIITTTSLNQIRLNEIALRDFVILTGVIYFLSQTRKYW